jgi:hypothetical protein
MMLISCKDASALASQSLDRRLGWRERAGLQLHLLVCNACTRFKKQIAFLRLAVRNGAEHLETEPVDALSADARARIRYSLQSEQ